MSTDDVTRMRTADAKARVLFIVSGATYWVLKDGTRYATGYWAEEFANPYKILTDAGHEVVVATPNGVTPNVDMMSLRPEMAGGIEGALELERIIRSAEAMRRPLKLSDVRLEDYDAVYLPGGHGPMADLAWDADCGRLLTEQLLSGRPLFIVCMRRPRCSPRGSTASHRSRATRSHASPTRKRKRSAWRRWRPGSWRPT